MNYIYRFYDKENKIIYVGKTNNLQKRFSQHKKKEWWYQVYTIDVAEVSNKYMTDIYEQYYINKQTTKYNIKDTNIKYLKFEFPELIFKKYNRR